MNNYITLAGASNGLPYCYVKLFQNANFNHCTEHLTTLHQTEEHPKSFLHRIKGYETIRNWFCSVLYGFVLGTIAYLKVRDISLNKVCAAKLLMAGTSYHCQPWCNPWAHTFFDICRTLYTLIYAASISASLSSSVSGDSVCPKIPPWTTWRHDWWIDWLIDFQKYDSKAQLDILIRVGTLEHIEPTRMTIIDPPEWPSANNFGVSKHQ